MAEQSTSPIVITPIKKASKKRATPAPAAAHPLESALTELKAGNIAATQKALEDYLASCAITSAGAPKKREKVNRPPSEFNIFIQEAMKREDIYALPPKERMKACAALWQEKKAAAAAPTAP